MTFGFSIHDMCTLFITFFNKTKVIKIAMKRYEKSIISYN